MNIDLYDAHDNCVLNIDNCVNISHTRNGKIYITYVDSIKDIDDTTKYLHFEAPSDYSFDVRYKPQLTCNVDLVMDEDIKMAMKRAASIISAGRNPVVTKEFTITKDDVKDLIRKKYIESGNIVSENFTFIGSGVLPGIKTGFDSIEVTFEVKEDNESAGVSTNKLF